MNPLLVDVPDELSTSRLTLRSPRPGEGLATNTAIRESIEELKPWMVWAQTIPSVEESEVYCRRNFARFAAREDLPFRGWLKETDTLIVSSGLHRINWDIPSFEIGYWVRTSFAGKGYVTEVVHALTQLAFQKLGAQRVEIRCDENNHKSYKIAERCGFTLEGILRNSARNPAGVLRSMRVYSRIASECGIH